MFKIPFSQEIKDPIIDFSPYRLIKALKSPIIEQFKIPFSEEIKDPTIDFVPFMFTKPIKVPIIEQFKTPFSEEIKDPTIDFVPFMFTKPIKEPIIEQFKIPFSEEIKDSTIDFENLDCINTFERGDGNYKFILNKNNFESKIAFSDNEYGNLWNFNNKIGSDNDKFTDPLNSFIKIENIPMPYEKHSLKRFQIKNTPIAYNIKSDEKLASIYTIDDNYFNMLNKFDVIIPKIIKLNDSPTELVLNKTTDNKDTPIKSDTAVIVETISLEKKMETLEDTPVDGSWGTYCLIM